MLSLVFLILVTFAMSAKGVYFVSIGNWGTDDANQTRAAGLMAGWCANRECDFVLGTGNNFYPRGVSSAADQRFLTTWKNVYNSGSLRNLVWYQSLGIVDYSLNREFYQVEHSAMDSLWHMPNLWYDFTLKDIDGSTVHFVVIDSTGLIEGLNRPEEQLRWINRTLAESTADWKIVVANFPPYSAGSAAPGSPVIRSQVVPLADKYGVDIFLSGYDSNLQHIVTNSEDGIDFIISGGGGQALDSKNEFGDALLAGLAHKANYFGHHHGVVIFEVFNEIIKVEFLNERTGMVDYSFNRHTSSKKKN